MEYEGKTITANMYSYWLSQIKSSYVSAANDTDAYWDTKYSNGQTYEEKMREIVDFNVKVNLICIKMFDDLGLEFTKEEKEELETSLSDLVQSFGSKSELNATLANYNINYKMLKQIYEIELKTTKVYDTLYASDFNWVAFPAPDSPFFANVKVRYKAKEAPATVIPLENGRVKVEFFEPQRAITPGQAAVVYIGDTLVGGGYIE